MRYVYLGDGGGGLVVHDASVLVRSAVRKRAKYWTRFLDKGRKSVGQRMRSKNEKKNVPPNLCQDPDVNVLGRTALISQKKEQVIFNSIIFKFKSIMSDKYLLINKH